MNRAERIAASEAAAAGQGSIPFDAAEARAEGLRAKALAWIAAHPDAWSAFERFALEAMRAGRDFGAKELAERVRWHSRFECNGEPFKVCNSFVAYFARELVRRHPSMRAHLRFRDTKF